MVKLSRQLISRLSDNVVAWEFQRKEVGCFPYDGEPSAASLFTTSSVSIIDKVVWDLKDFRRMLQDWEGEFCKDNQQGVSYLSYSECEGGPQQSVWEMRRLIKTAQCSSESRK